MPKSIVRCLCVLSVVLIAGCSKYVQHSGAASQDAKIVKAIADLETKTAELEQKQEALSNTQQSNSQQAADSVSVSVQQTETISTGLDGQETIEETVVVEETITAGSGNQSTAQTGSSIYSQPVIPGFSDLPSNPKPGECYVNSWSEPIYQTITDVVKIKDEEEIIDIIPAQYETVVENVLVREASTRIEPVSAVYTIVDELVEISPAEQKWIIGSALDSPQASETLIEEARAAGFDFEANAVNGQCYVEHFFPARFETYTEQLLVKEETERVDVIPARYGLVDKQVLVEPEKERIVPIPAVYEEVTETIIDSPARSEWQQCGGSAELGQVMCFVEIPATYKTVTRKALKSPAGTRTEVIPARYETVSVREVIEEAREVRTVEPAQYEVVVRQRQISDPVFAWHPINSESSRTRTGRQLCYQEIPAEYRVVPTQKLVEPASSKTIEVAAEYRTVPVQKLVTPEQTRTRVIPAQFETVSRQEMIRPGRMEWRAILCVANYTTDIIALIQQELKDLGYSIEKVDGKLGPNTKSELKRYQSDNQLPVDDHLNVQTLRALGIEY